MASLDDPAPAAVVPDCDAHKFEAPVTTTTLPSNSLRLGTEAEEWGTIRFVDRNTSPSVLPHIVRLVRDLARTECGLAR